MNQKSKPQPHPITAVATTLLRELARRPDDVIIRETLVGTILAIEIEAHADDRPRLIGSQGKHIAAFNRVMKAMGVRRGLEVVIDLIVPPNPPEHTVHPQFEPNPNWNSAAIKHILRVVCLELLTHVPPIEGHVLRNMTILKINFPPYAMSFDVLAALNVLFGAIGYKQGRVVRVAGPGAIVESEVKQNEPTRKG